MHVSGVFTQRTQISPLTLDVTTNRYFIVQRGTPNIFWKITTIILSHPPHTHNRYNSPTVQCHGSFLSSPWTLFISFHVRGHYSFHVRGHYLFLSLSFSRGPLSASNYFPSYVGLHPNCSFNLVDSPRPRLPRCASTSCLQFICVVSARQVQPLVPAATYNRVSMSLCS